MSATPPPTGYGSSDDPLLGLTGPVLKPSNVGNWGTRVAPNAAQHDDSFKPQQQQQQQFRPASYAQQSSGAGYRQQSNRFRFRSCGKITQESATIVTKYILFITKL